MKRITKSRYVSYKTCPKSLWLSLFHSELAKEDPTAEKHINDGKEVGMVAKGYFPNTVDVLSLNEDGSLDISNMIGLTNRYLAEGDKVIAEASFSVDNLFCSVDLLKPFEDGYEIYEVKATTNVEKEHLIDAAFQKYVLEARGLKILGTYILHLNSDYRREGELDLSKLFVMEKVDYAPLFIQTYGEVKYDISRIEDLFKSEVEPDVLLSSTCKACPFKEYCQRNLPHPNVLELNGIRNGYDRLNEGIVTFKDAILNEIKLNKRQKVQIQAYLEHKEVIIDEAGVRDFLDTVKYPIYHLDFESIQLPIPPCDKAWPYEQIPTQYSLHIEYKDGRLEHKEFLGDSIDPRRGIAEALCRDIPLNACVMAYNKTFECGRIRELADLYPDLKDHLLNMADNVVDLIIPFKKGDYYHEKMFHSNSIKYVLPALYPDDPELDYHALPVVHNGGEAMDIYPKMLVASKEEQDRIRDGLLKYCCLDTLAMVKVLRKLKEV